MTPGSGTLTNTGSFLINNSGTTVSVNGNALNTGYLALGDYNYGSGGGTLNISGTLSNSGNVAIGGFPGYTGMAQIGALNNNGSFSVDGGSMVSITGNVLNNGSLFSRNPEEGG